MHPVHDFLPRYHHCSQAFSYAAAPCHKFLPHRPSSPRVPTMPTLLPTSSCCSSAAAPPPRVPSTSSLLCPTISTHVAAPLPLEFHCIQGSKFIINFLTSVMEGFLLLVVTFCVTLAAPMVARHGSISMATFQISC